MNVRQRRGAFFTVLYKVFEINNKCPVTGWKSFTFSCVQAHGSRWHEGVCVVLRLCSPGWGAMPSGLVVLGLLLLLCARAQAFAILPGNSLNHQEITERAILDMTVQVCRSLAQAEGTDFTAPVRISFRGVNFNQHNSICFCVSVVLVGFNFNLCACTGSAFHCRFCCHSLRSPQIVQEFPPSHHRHHAEEHKNRPPSRLQWELSLWRGNVYPGEENHHRRTTGCQSEQQGRKFWDSERETGRDLPSSSGV